MKSNGVEDTLKIISQTGIVSFYYAKEHPNNLTKKYIQCIN